MSKGGIPLQLFRLITTAFSSQIQLISIKVFVWLSDSLRAYTEPGNSDPSFCFPDYHLRDVVGLLISKWCGWSCLECPSNDSGQRN